MEPVEPADARKRVGHGLKASQGSAIRQGQPDDIADSRKREQRMQYAYEAAIE